MSESNHDPTGLQYTFEKFQPAFNSFISENYSQYFKQSEKALSETNDFEENDLNSLFFGHCRDFTKIIDQGGRILYASKTHEQILDYSIDYLKDCKIFDLLYDSDKDVFSKKIGDLQPEKKSVSTEIRLRKASGDPVYVEMILYAFGENGHILVSSRDISDAWLKQEKLKKQEQALRRLSLQLVNVIDSQPSQIAILNENGELIYANESWYSSVYGYLADRHMTDPENRSHTIYLENGMRFDQTLVQKKIESILNGEVEIVEDDLYVDSAEPDWFRLIIKPLEMETERGAMLMFVDTTEHKSLNRKLSESLNRKDMLLKEAYHRTKNNLQIVSSMLRFQSQAVNNDFVRRVLKDCENRTMSMAVINEKLQESENGGEIRIAEFIKTLCNNLNSLINTNKEISIESTCDDVMLNSEVATSCGLIINELVTNSLKYAFPHKKKSKIMVTFQQKGQDCLLVISDNGVGLPEGFDYRKAKGLGMRLVSMLTEQLRGKLQAESRNGSTFKLTFRV